MEAKKYVLKFVVIALTALLVMSCLLPGMIPLKSTPVGPMPVMEKDGDKVIQVLKGKDWHRLESLAKEKYTEADFAKPGTLTFTVDITDDNPIYFSYGWCTKTQEILQQNFQHIKIGLYFNGDQLGTDVVQSLSYNTSDNMYCLDFGVLFSEWPAGEYKLKAVATFDQKINDGIADYEAGDYIFDYDVTVKK